MHRLAFLIPRESQRTNLIRAPPIHNGNGKNQTKDAFPYLDNELYWGEDDPTQH